MARRKKVEDSTEANNNNPIIQDDIDFYFYEFCQLHNIKDIYKIPSTQFVAALIYINNKYIRPNRIVYNNALSGYKYNLLAIDQLVDRFLYMSYIYNQPITLLNFSHFSGIDYQYICTWKQDKNTITIDLLDSSNNKYIYNKELPPGKKTLTISYHNIYEKLVDNQINNADLLASYKSGVNSIAWANRVHDRHDKDRNNNQPVFDMVSAADSLGISDKIQALEDRKKQ